MFMRHVGIREFRDKATGLLRGPEPLAVERHGKVIGFYIPVEEQKAGNEQFREALARLERTVEEVIEKTGMTEEELAAAFELGKERSGRAGAGR
jgi:hypothetical protein